MLAITQKEKLSLLNQAILNEDMQKVESILESSPESILQKDDAGDTPAHIAVQKGNIPALKMILEAKPELALEKNNAGDTPIYFALLNDSSSALEVLLKFNPELTQEKDKNGNTPIHFAVSKDKLSALEVLLKFNPELAQEKDTNGDSLIYLAILNDTSSAAEVLLKFNPDLALVKNQYGNTPIHFAAFNDKLSALEVLLKFNPEVALEKDKDDYTPLHLAVLDGHQKIVHLLLSTCDLGIVELTTNNGHKAVDLISMYPYLSVEKSEVRALDNEKILEQLSDAANIHRVMNLEPSNGNNTAAKVEIKNIELLISKACKLFSTQPIVFNDASKEHKSKAQIIKQVSDNIELTNEQLSQLKTALDGTQLQLIYNNGLPPLKELAALSPFANSVKILLDETKNDDQKEQELWNIVKSQAVFIDTKDRGELVVKYPHIFNEISKFNPEIAAELLRVMTCTKEQMLADQENDSDNQEATDTQTNVSPAHSAYLTDSYDVGALGNTDDIQMVD